MDLIERARKYVEKMPAAISGQGGHNATFHVACVLVQGFGLSPEQAWPLLAEYNLRCAPAWSDKELRHKLKGADKQSARRGRGWLAKGAEWTPSQEWRDYHRMADEPKAVYESEKLRKFSGEWARKVDLIWLANRSALDPAVVGAGRFLQTLYKQGERVCVFWREFATMPGEGMMLWPEGDIPLNGDARRPAGVWFLAQPVDGEYHPNDDPERPASCRNHRAVTAWRYMVVESDEADTRQWLGALAQLPLRIAAIYSSGGRSVHALVRVDARTKGEWDGEKERLKPALTVLGADPKTFSAVRLTRLPGCVRRGKFVEDKDSAPDPKTGKPRKIYTQFKHPKLQKLLYINPTPPLAPLVDVFARRDVVKYWTDVAAAGVADTDETGGRWIEEGLKYYAGVNGEVGAALEEWRAQ